MNVRNFEKFKEDHWYIYTGEKQESFWGSIGYMDYVLGHQPLQCKKAKGNSYASFKGGEECMWNWISGFENWIEIFPCHLTSKKTKVGEYYYHQDTNKLVLNKCISVKCTGHNNFALPRSPFNKLFEDDISGNEYDGTSSDIIYQDSSEDKMVKVKAYKIGDKVLIKKVIEYWNDPDRKRIEWVDEMDNFVGKFVVIDKIRNTSTFTIEGSNRLFPFECLEDYKIGDIVIIRQKIEKWESNIWESNIWCEAMDRYIDKKVKIMTFDKKAFKAIAENSDFPYYYPIECLISPILINMHSGIPFPLGYVTDVLLDKTLASLSYDFGLPHKAFQISCEPEYVSFNLKIKEDKNKFKIFDENVKIPTPIRKQKNKFKI